MICLFHKKSSPQYCHGRKIIILNGHISFFYYIQVAHSIQEYHSQICHNEKTRACYAHTPFYYYDCFATISYLEETSLSLMCNVSALGQDSPWMEAIQK